MVGGAGKTGAGLKGKVKYQGNLGMSKAYEVCAVWGKPLSVSELPTVRSLTDTALTLRTAGAVLASSSLLSLKTS